MKQRLLRSRQFENNGWLLLPGTLKNKQRPAIAGWTDDKKRSSILRELAGHEPMAGWSGVEDYQQFDGGVVSEFSGDIGSYAAGGDDVVPAGALLGHQKILRLDLGGNGSRRDCACV